MNINGALTNVTDKKRPAPHSKKHTLKKLAPGWACKLFDIQLKTSLAQPERNRGTTTVAVAISIATGLRPEELEKGVVLRLIDNNFVEIEIKGAKVAEDKFGEEERGIKIRWVTISPEYSAASKFLTKEMIRLAAERGTKEISYTYSSSTLRKVVNNLGKKYLAQHQPRQQSLQISPYCFRHLMAANIKSCTALTEIERAQILGHLSVKSMQSYARAFRTKTPVKPVLAVRTTQVPTLGKVPPSVKFAKNIKTPAHKAPSPTATRRFSHPTL